MKKLLALTGMAVMVFASCTKETPGTDPNAPQDVIFTSAIENGGLKGLKADDPTVCTNPDADYAQIVINKKGSTDTETYTPSVFIVNNNLYTQAVKLNPGEYEVAVFTLMDNSGTPDDTSDDVIVRATPNRGSNFSVFVSATLPINFTVAPFQKLEIPIEVLCFQETTYKDFGFAWFLTKETTIRQKLFFGDFCTKYFLDYAGSAYEHQTHGLQLDMPAIFKIEVYNNGNLVTTYSNESYYGEGKPLSVKYSDIVNQVDNFEFKLYILVKIGETFGYKYMNSWFFEDAEEMDTQIGTGPGPDGVYDFVLGNCNAELADYAFAPYMNLPESASMYVTLPNDDASRKGYLTMHFSNIGNGFDIANGNLDGFCFDRGTVIYTSTNYNVSVYSSLLPASVLPDRIKNKEWDRVNWLANHLNQFEGYKWYELQQVLWKLEDPAWLGSSNAGVPGVSFTEATSMAKKMLEAAVAYGDGFVPLPGGWAAVACINADASHPIQTVFTIVDP
jgi:hypothetical protein